MKISYTYFAASFRRIIRFTHLRDCFDPLCNPR